MAMIKVISFNLQRVLVAQVQSIQLDLSGRSVRDNFAPKQDVADFCLKAMPQFGAF